MFDLLLTYMILIYQARDGKVDMRDLNVRIQHLLDEQTAMRTDMLKQLHRLYAVCAKSFLQDGEAFNATLV